MSAEGQIKAFIDRILRLKEEQDVIGDDIRDIYAEAKGMGFDKTAMGQVVQLIRKRGKIGEEAFSEQNAIVELYLSAYEGPALVLAGAVASHTPAGARVRENIEKFDPETGEIINPRRPSNNDKASPEAGPQAEASPAGTGTETLADREGRHDGEAASVDLPTNSDTQSAETDGGSAPPSERVSPAVDTGIVVASPGGEDVDRSATRAGLEGGPVNLEPSGPEAERATSFTAKPPSPLRPHCRQPEACGGYGRNHCHTCAKAMREREPAEELA